MGGMTWPEHGWQSNTMQPHELEHCSHMNPRKAVVLVHIYPCKAWHWTPKALPALSCQSGSIQNRQPLVHDTASEPAILSPLKACIITSVSYCSPHDAPWFQGSPHFQQLISLYADRVNGPQLPRAASPVLFLGCTLPQVSAQSAGLAHSTEINAHTLHCAESTR